MSIGSRPKQKDPLPTVKIKVMMKQSKCRPNSLARMDTMLLNFTLISWINSDNNGVKMKELPLSLRTDKFKRSLEILTFLQC